MPLLLKEKGESIVIPRDEEGRYREEIAKRDNVESRRLQRYLAMPDLSRTQGSPLYELIHRMVDLPYFKGFDIINVPEIVPVDISFDLFDFPPEHPARKPSDTYFVTNDRILRTHTTVMWYYYLTSELVKSRMANNEAFGVFCHGKVYRKDEIDRNHMNIFHQVDGLYLAPTSERAITRIELEEALREIARGIFGNDIEFRFNDDNFPYTHSSIEMEVKIKGHWTTIIDGVEVKLGERWVEVLGGGIAQPSVLEKLGVDSKKYTGWAFGFGLERLAIISMNLPDIRLLWSEDPRVKAQLKLGQAFVEVSKYPPITRDISFVVAKDFEPNNYFDLIRDIVPEDMLEEVKLIDSYENAEKFGADRKSYTYRVVYRSNNRTLTNEEIDPLQKRVYEETARVFSADLR